jgi:hypothetical protein
MNLSYETAIKQVASQAERLEPIGSQAVKAEFD